MSPVWECPLLRSHTDRSPFSLLSLSSLRSHTRLSALSPLSSNFSIFSVSQLSFWEIWPEDNLYHRWMLFKVTKKLYLNIEQWRRRWVFLRASYSCFWVLWFVLDDLRFGDCESFFGCLRLIMVICVISIDTQKERVFVPFQSSFEFGSSLILCSY